MVNDESRVGVAVDQRSADAQVIAIRRSIWNALDLSRDYLNNGRCAAAAENHQEHV
jgi:hypothetical protein